MKYWQLIITVLSKLLSMILDIWKDKMSKETKAYDKVKEHIDNDDDVGDVQSDIDDLLNGL